MSLWVRLPGTDATAFARAAFRAGVAVAGPSPLTCVPSRHADRLRLSFSLPPARLAEAVARLADVAGAA